MQIVAMTGLSYLTVRSAIDLFDAGSCCAIRLALRGRARGDGRMHSQVQEVIIQRTIIDIRPEQLNMDLHLKSRAAVGQLIEQELGIKLQVRHIGKISRPLGLDPAKTHQKLFMLTTVTNQRKAR